MRPIDTARLMKIMKAHIDGKNIQRRRPAGIWVAEPDPDWNFTNWEYRVKPEPREFWAVIPKQLPLSHIRNWEIYPYKPDEVQDDYVTIKVREVLEDGN